MTFARFVCWSLALGAVLSSPAMGLVFEVGTGKPYTTVQSAVNAAAALDGSGTPIDIVVYTGLYPEDVAIPADASNQFNGINDGWTIRSNPGDEVWLDGGSMSFGQDRDNLTVTGINIKMRSGKTAISFNQTSRSNLIKDAVIYGGTGTGGFPAIGGDLFYGTNTIDHVTIYKADYGPSVGYASSVNVSNSIIAGASGYSFYSSNGSAISYSNLFSAVNVAGGGYDAGGNLNWPTGMDPLFASTTFGSPNFLWLSAVSPAAGTAATAGTRTMGQLNMGALPAVPEPATLALLALGSLTLLRRRSAV
jgi:hypothetical protein